MWFSLTFFIWDIGQKVWSNFFLFSLQLFIFGPAITETTIFGSVRLVRCFSWFPSIQVFALFLSLVFVCLWKWMCASCDYIWFDNFSVVIVVVVCDCDWWWSWCCCQQMANVDASMPTNKSNSFLDISMQKRWWPIIGFCLIKFSLCRCHRCRRCYCTNIVNA